MNAIKLATHGARTTFVLLVFLSQSANTLAKDKACQVDFFERPQYSGTHVQLTGPIELKNLTALNGENWESRISSLKVGATATLTVFENTDFKLASTPMAKSPELLRSWGITKEDVEEESELIFHPNTLVHDLSDFQFEQKVKSLKISCTK